MRCKHGRRKGGQGGQGPLGFENFSKKIVFLISSGKKTDFTTFAPPGKILEKSSSAPFVENLLPTPMAASERQYTAAGGEVQAPRGGIHQ